MSAEISTVPARLRLIVITVSVVLLVAEFVALYVGVPQALRGASRFRQLYNAGYMVRVGNGAHFYDPEANARFQNEVTGQVDRIEVFNAPAYEALLLAPFSLLTYRIAYFAFFAINLVLLGFSIRALQPFLPQLENVWPRLPAAVFLCFFPSTLALIDGHDSIILLALMAASAVSFYRERDFRAGVFLGLALFQIQLVLPIALLFLLWQKWKIIAGFFLTGVAVTALSLIIAGPRGLLASIHNSVLFNSSLGAPASTIPNLRCLLHSVASSIASPGKLDVVWVIGSVLLLAWAATRTPNFALAILATLLVSSQGTICDAILLIIPIAMVLDARLTVTSGTSRLWSRNVAGMLFIAPAVCFFTRSTYCALALLMVGLLMPLRYTSADILPSESAA